MKKLDVPQSGSQASTTASRNRFGQYNRNRSIPVNPNSSAQAAVRARMSANAAAWRSLTDAQRAGWSSLGAAMSRRDSLGQAYTLTGFQAYCSVNNNLDLTGAATVSAAPAIVSPSALLTATVTTTGGVLSIAFTPTPLPAATKALLFASPQRSAGRSFENDLRYIMQTAAAGVSPINALAAYTAKFGAPVVGSKIFFSLITSSGGFTSGPLLFSTVVIA